MAYVTSVFFFMACVYVCTAVCAQLASFFVFIETYQLRKSRNCTITVEYRHYARQKFRVQFYLVTKRLRFDGRAVVMRVAKKKVLFCKNANIFSSTCFFVFFWNNKCKFFVTTYYCNNKLRHSPSLTTYITSVECFTLRYKNKEMDVNSAAVFFFYLWQRQQKYDNIRCCLSLDNTRKRTGA
ncbi:hypothetical protein BDC45DRAFT_531506 [Circinella umbellata]|nr:hypothetical protein BDC45DRAFT_531506 [Circinella umbellata]